MLAATGYLMLTECALFCTTTQEKFSVAQAQLGHADPSITLGIYSHVIGDSQRHTSRRWPEFWTILDYKSNLKVN